MENNTIEEMKIFLKVLNKVAQHVCKQILKEEKQPAQPNELPQKQLSCKQEASNLELCSTKQAQMIFARTKYLPEIRKQILDQYGRTDNIPKNKVREICQKIDKAEGK